MVDEQAADLSLIARQQRQLLSGMGTMRDDMGVTHSRLNNRVRELETVRPAWSKAV